MYEELKAKFARQYARQAEYIFSAPGRTELGGNHTDHQHGLVLAAAVTLDTKAAVAENGDGCIRVMSEGYAPVTVSIDELSPRPDERNATAALVRGVAAGFARHGYAVRGFDAYVVSDVLPGSGLSSSAAFEVLIGTVINVLSGCALSPAEVARIGQYAENEYFGKPSGLMDQTASAVGGIVAIDFADPAAPVITPVEFDFAACGYALCIIDSGAGHAELTAEYAAIPNELKAVCRVFGKEYLREVDEREFCARIAEVRRAAGDRAVLRAAHVFSENRRCAEETAALGAGDFEHFLQLVSESGRSSWMYLQNVVPTGSTARQELAFALLLCDRFLDGRGAFRVHGGGFAGTVQAFVPADMLEGFRVGIDAVLGAGSCHVLSIRRAGGCLIEKL